MGKSQLQAGDAVPYANGVSAQTRAGAGRAGAAAGGGESVHMVKLTG